MAFWGAPGVLGEAPARAVAGWRPRGTVGVGKRRREPAGPVGCRHRGCRGARAATPPAQHVAQLKVTVPRATRRGDRAQWPRHSHTLCQWPLFSGRVSGTERFRWHRRIPVAPVVRKGEPALSSPGRCPAGAAVTHGPGGCGQRLELPNLSIGGWRPLLCCTRGFLGLVDASTPWHRGFSHQGDPPWCHTPPIFEGSLHPLTHHSPPRAALCPTGARGCRDAGACVPAAPCPEPGAWLCHGGSAQHQD